ncbi:SRPBCC family protein [Variovorax sp. LT1P1]|uniref:SRPBCC family protein n=1 Tax=Variovorax sp. LT1P1 TaxID=3443730 RepID=UPI003F4882C4
MTDNAHLTPFTLSRTFDAPRARVWEAFTTLEHLETWWGPKGFAIRSARLDLRPGGMFVYAMEAGGQTMWGRFVYREIEAPGRIVFVNSFSDAEGGLTRAPFADAWPMEILNTWTFTESDGKTTLDIHSVPLNANAVETAVFLAGFPSMQMGFGGTLDQLAGHLASQG